MYLTNCSWNWFRVVGQVSAHWAGGVCSRRFAVVAPGRAAVIAKIARILVALATRGWHTTGFHPSEGCQSLRVHILEYCFSV